MPSASRAALGVGTAFGLALLLSTPPRACATLLDAPVTAVVTASSSSGSLSRALDADADTRWCPAPGDARGELSIRFAHPVKVKKVTVVAGRVGLQVAPDSYRPPRLRASLDQLVAEVDPTENGTNPLELEAFRDKEGQSFVLRLEPAGASRSGARDRCLSDLEIELEDATWVTGVPAAGAAKLPGFVNELASALRACDGTALRRLVQIPLRREELGVGSAGAELHAASAWGARPTASYPSLRSVVKDCRQLVFPAGEDPPTEPRPRRSLGVGGFRVTGNGGGGVTYWDITWRKDGWVLSRIAFTDFE